MIALPFSAPRIHPRPKVTVVLAFILCPILLFMSGYGFWRWANLPSAVRLVTLDEIYYLLCLVIIPLILFLFLSVVAGQRLEYNRLSTSYQARIDQLQKRLNTQDDLMRVITNHDPSAITIFDKDNRFWFANATVAQQANLDVKDIIGKSLLKVFGHELARTLEVRLNETRNSRRKLNTLDQRPDSNGQPHFIQTHFEAVAYVGDFTDGVIMRSEDVTSLIVERERRETMLRQVIGTLVAVVDRRDPYASGHSARVGKLSRAIAEEMMLEEKNIEASEVAGSLMNFGKVLVPREILTKTTALAPEELQRVRDSILTSADILSIIDFSGPVVSTLKQVLERIDGTGTPDGLKGDDILITARIVAVANTYIALVSPRAHRPSLDFREAVQIIMKDADKIYDRSVVLALANYVENHSTRLDWLGATKQS